MSRIFPISLFRQNIDCIRSALACDLNLQCLPKVLGTLRSSAFVAFVTIAITFKYPSPLLIWKVIVPVFQSHVTVIQSIEFSQNLKF